MARKRPSNGINKSEKIREYLRAHRGAGPKEVQQALAAQGIEVSDGLISNVKYSKKGPGRRKSGVKKRVLRRRPGRKPGRKSSAKGSVPAEHLFEAKRLVDRVGGIEEARGALDALNRLL